MNAVDASLLGGLLAGGLSGRGVRGRMNGCNRLLPRRCPGSRKHGRGFGVVAGAEGAAGACLQAGALSHSGCWGPPATRDRRGETLLSQFHGWPELTGALQASDRLPRPGTAGRRRAPTPLPCVPLAWLSSSGSCAPPPTPWSCFCWVPVFFPSPGLDCELPEDRRCDLVKTFPFLSFFSFCSTHPEAGWAGCSESKGLSLR